MQPITRDELSQLVSRVTAMREQIPAGAHTTLDARLQKLAKAAANLHGSLLSAEADGVRFEAKGEE